MLVEFSVANYLSIKDRVTFSMVASSLTGHEEDHLIDLGKLTLLKSAVVYGANASGKTNLLVAMGFMKRFVITSSKETQATEEIKVESFRLNTETESEPSEFEVTFIHEDIPYRYGFTIDRYQVYKEWLYYAPKGKEAKLFERDREWQERIKLGTYFKEGKGLESKTRDNALFLSVVAQFNGEISKKIIDWFVSHFNVISGTHQGWYEQFTIERLSEYKPEILSFLKQADDGIMDIVTMEIQEKDLPDKLPNDLKQLLLSRKEVQTKRSKLDANGEVISIEIFEMDEHESEGTRKLFALSGPIIESLKNGEVLIVDELDAKLHPLMTRFIIGLFNSKEKNPNNAQLIFATHDTSILSNRFFRRDQIWFTEKNHLNSTDLYSLAEFKVKKDASFGKDYIEGKYGAIPYVGDPELIVGVRNAKE